MPFNDRKKKKALAALAASSMADQVGVSAKTKGRAGASAASSAP